MYYNGIKKGAVEYDEIRKLQTQLYNSLTSKNLTFNELVNLLDKTELPEARDVILDVMEIQYKSQFINWLNN